MKKRTGCLAIILAAVAVIAAGFIAINPAILRFGTIAAFGAEQYVNNIAHFQRGRYVRMKVALPAYRSVLPLSVMSNRSAFTLSERIVELSGYTPRGSVTWVALTAYRGTRPEHFYVMIPEPLAAVGGDSTNDYFGPADPAYLETFRMLFTKEYRDAVRERVAITVPEDNVAEQKLREDRSFAELTDISSKPVFCKRADLPLVERIRAFYTGRKNETIRLLQLDDSFTLEKNF